MKHYLPLLLSVSILGAGFVSLPPALAQGENSVAQLPGTSAEGLEQAQENAEAFIDAMVNQEYEQAIGYLHPSLQAAWTPEDVEQQWQTLLEANGEFRRFSNARPTVALDRYLVLLTLAFANTTTDLLITLNSDQEIVGVDLFQSEENIQARAEEFVDDLAAGDYAQARFHLHPTLKAELFPEDLQAKWEGLQNSTGAFQRRLDSQVINGGGDTNLVLVNIEFANQTDSLVVIFDGLGRITGVDFPQD